MLTQAELKAMLHYDPLTGAFTWLNSTCGSIAAGSKAGHAESGHRKTYIRISINNKKYYAHRLAWLYLNGAMPAGLVDHIDGDGTNNRSANLRLATYSQNAANARGPAGRKKGTTRRKDGRWVAQITVAGVNRYLGIFDTEDAAHAAYKRSAEATHGPYARAE